VENNTKKPIPLMLDESLLPENRQKEIEDLQRKKELMERLKQYENSIGAGKDPVTGNYFPHKSIEGGKDTLAFGDKLLEGKYSPEEIDRIYTQGISEQQAEDSLMRNINNAEQGAQRIMQSKGIEGLDPVQKEALTEMVFQLGAQGTTDFKKMIQALKQGNYQLAEREALNSKWAMQDSPKRAREVASRLRYGKLVQRLSKK